MNIVCKCGTKCESWATGWHCPSCNLMFDIHGKEKGYDTRVFSVPESEPCFYCNELQAILNAGLGIEIGEVGIFYDPYCPHCGRKLRGKNE